MLKLDSYYYIFSDNNETKDKIQNFLIRVMMNE